jgi:hypothetical protein
VPTPKGYTTVQLVAEELGDAIDISQMIDQCNTLIAQAEAFIDRYTARAWAVVSPIVDELHTVTGRYLYLKSAPVTAITSLSIRTDAVGALDAPLVAGTAYELIDAANGIVLLSSAGHPYGYDVVVNTTDYARYIAKVSYTTTSPVPGDIQRAATLLVAQWFQGRLNSDARGVQSYSVGSSGDTFGVTFGKQNVPDDVMRLLGGRRAVLFA